MKTLSKLNKLKKIIQRKNRKDLNQNSKRKHHYPLMLTQDKERYFKYIHTNEI